MRVLVTAASRQGATAEIAEAIGRVLRERGLTVEVVPPMRVEGVEGFDAVVLGSALYSGHWLEPATALAERCAGALAARPVWLFSSGPVGDPSRRLARAMARDPAELPRLMERTAAREHRLFAGRLESHGLGFAQRAALVVFRGLRGDFRDWPAIECWAAGIADALQGPS